MEIHRQNVVHRDLKTENLLLTEDLSLKICDFGSSRTIFSSNSPHFYYIETPLSAIGSPEYNPPEIRRGLSSKNVEDLESSEVFTLGCVLFLMVKFF